MDRPKMPSLLETQKSSLRRHAEGAGFRAQLEWDLGTKPTVFYKGGHGYFFQVEENQVRYSPGETTLQKTEGTAGDFNVLLSAFAKWLESLQREVRHHDLIGAGDTSPVWLVAEMPQQYRDAAATVARLTADMDGMNAIGRLLWQTGLPLNDAVRDVFVACGYGAELTERGATYDVTVILDDRRRLLLEVTGIEGNIQKKSPKIGQLFQTTQEIATEHDRVILAANTFRISPVLERKDDHITPDALKLVKRMGANFVTTANLFGVWKAFLIEPELARQHIEKLHALDGGVFELTGAAQR
jgi:hypothetical protein